MEPIRIVGWEGSAILGLMTVLVLYKAAGNREWWRNVLRVEELQLLVVTMTVSGKVAVDLLTGPRGTMPPVGAEFLTLFGVSSAVYAAFKGFRVAAKR